MGRQHMYRVLIAFLIGVLGLGAMTTVAQDGGEATAESNRAFITEYVAAISGQDKTPELVDRYVAEGDTFLRNHIATFEPAFPRYELLVDDMIAEGDRVVIRATVRGTHQGDFLGIPPTGNEIDIDAIVIYRIEDGKIAETWAQVDAISLMQQLGALPAPEAASEDMAETEGDSMTPIVLQINYQFDSTPAEHLELWSQVAEAIAATPGLISKTWLMNEADHEAGGIYVFESREAAEAYLNGEIITALAALPEISNVSAKFWDTNEEFNQITRSPLATAEPT